MAVVTAASAEVELTDELASAFLEELVRLGSIRKAARSIGVDLRLMYERRWCDEEFRWAWNDARRRRLYAASDELFLALDGFRRVIRGDVEQAADELINVIFGPSEPPLRRGVCPAALAQARERLHEAGKQWAAAVVAAESPRELEAVA